MLDLLRLWEPLEVMNGVECYGLRRCVWVQSRQLHELVMINLIVNLIRIRSTLGDQSVLLERIN
jgi:hypothetical protein